MPFSVIVPLPVMGELPTVSQLRSVDRPTLVTVPLPVPAPMSERNVAALSAVTLLSALIFRNVIAPGFVSVNRF